MRTWAIATLAAGSLLAAGAATAPAAAEPAAEVCDGVTVVVDYNELGGDTRHGCADTGTAAEAFDEAGFELEFVPQMPDFVCRVTGVPDNGPCTDGDSYWSLWWSDGSADWTYATFGVSSLDVPHGGTVGFSWHEGSGDAAPPDPAVPHAAGCPDWPECDSVDAAADAEGSPADEDGSFPLWAMAVLVLGAAAVPILRRRRS